MSLMPKHAPAHIARELGELYLREWSKDGAPNRVLLDSDVTVAPTHGNQESSYYHGYYKTHMCTTLWRCLRRRDQPAGHGTLAARQHSCQLYATLSGLKRVVRRLRVAWG